MSQATPLLDGAPPGPSFSFSAAAKDGPYGSTDGPASDEDDTDRLMRREGDESIVSSTRSSDAARVDRADHPSASLHPLRIVSLLATAFCYGCTMTTLFLLVLPIECVTIESKTGGRVSKSVALGVFAAIAGASQLVCPLVGMLSDRYSYKSRRGSSGGGGGGGGRRKKRIVWIKGRRMPYLLLGTFLFLFGIFGVQIASFRSTYRAFTALFVVAMVGINVVYCVMIALIPDHVPHHLTGLANGTLALLLVTGSLFAFAMFKTVLDQSVQMMYVLYNCVMATTAAITFLSANPLADGSSSGEVAPDGAEDVADAKKSLWRITSAILSLGLVPALRKMISDPLSRMEWSEVRHAYWVDPTVHHDFFVVTVSRLFYYLGLSAQCFFLYFIHDVIHEHHDPEAAASMLAIVTTAAGAVTCYPVGLVSDRWAGGRRKPFVYGACAVLAGSNLGLLACTTLRQMVGVCSALGAANGVYLTMDTSLAVDTLPPEPPEVLPDKVEKKSNDLPKTSDDGAAQLLGIWGVAGFVGSALGPLVGGPLLYVFGSGDSSDGTGGYRWEGYAVVMSLSAFYFACSAATLRWINDPHI